MGFNSVINKIFSIILLAQFKLTITLGQYIYIYHHTCHFRNSKLKLAIGLITSLILKNFFFNPAQFEKNLLNKNNLINYILYLLFFLMGMKKTKRIIKLGEWEYIIFKLSDFPYSPLILKIS